jgi:hypothetical protein
VAETRTARGADNHVTDLAGEFADRLREELDFRLEARNATEIAAARSASGASCSTSPTCPRTGSPQATRCWPGCSPPA